MSARPSHERLTGCSRRTNRHRAAQKNENAQVSQFPTCLGCQDALPSAQGITVARKTGKAILKDSMDETRRQLMAALAGRLTPVRGNLTDAQFGQLLADMLRTVERFAEIDAKPGAHGPAVPTGQGCRPVAERVR